MIDTLLLLAIIVGLIAIVYPRQETYKIEYVSEWTSNYSYHLIIMLWFLQSQDEISALDEVYLTIKADLIRHGKNFDEGFMTQCLTITENYYESCRAKLQLNGATDIASLN